MGTTIRCGTLIVGQEQPPIHNAFVSIDVEGRILGVDREPPGWERPEDLVDWSGYTVIPGLIDAHDHPDIDLGDEVAQATAPQAWATLVAVRNLKTILGSGITTLRWTGARDRIDIVFRRAVAEGLVAGPRLLASGKLVARTGGHGWFWGHEADGPDAVRRAVREEVKTGVDWLKIMVTGGVATPGSDPISPGYTRDEIWAAVDEAHMHGKRIACHAYGGQGLRWAVEAGIDTVEHGALAHEELLELMAQNGTTLVSTMGIMEAGLLNPDVPSYAQQKFLAVKDAYLTTLRRAREIGVSVIVGTDINHAQLVRELEVLTEVGYSPLEALGSATWQAAKCLGIDQETGSITSGKWADMVAVKGNPLEGIGVLKNVAGVCIQGRLVGS